jgi:trigger factor
VTLTIQTEQDDKRQLLVTIEVPEERVQLQMRETARKLARDFKIPGFRPGKAPYHVVVQRLGRDALRGEAVEAMLQPIFEEAMEQLNPDIYAPAQFDNVELEPLVLKFIVPLEPEVDLGDYRGLRKEIEAVNVSDEAVADALERIRGRHQVLEDVERPSEVSDMVIIKGRGELILEAEDEEDIDEAEAETFDEVVDDEADDDDFEDDDFEDEDDDEFEDDFYDDEDDVLFDTERMNLVLDSSKLFPGTPFVENLTGMSVGDSKEFSFTFPEDYEEEELAGKEAMFSIEVLQVQSRELPGLDEELAQKEGHETLEELEEETRQGLRESAEEVAKNELIDGMVHDMLAMATLVYPPAAVEMEIDGRIQSFKSQVQRSGWEWDDYLKLQTTTEEELRGDFQNVAEDAVRHQLILRQFVLNEKLQISEEDIEAKIGDRVAAFSDNETLANSMRDYYKKGGGFQMISGEILIDKVAERMKAILSGNAPSLEELATLEEEAEEETAAEAEDVVEVENEETAVTESPIE